MAVVRVHAKYGLSGKVICTVQILDTETVNTLEERLKDKLQCSSARKPHVHLQLSVVKDGQLLQAGDTLVHAGIHNESDVVVIVKGPLLVCAIHGSEEDYDEDGDILTEDFPRVRLNCCGARICRNCWNLFYEIPGSPCQFCKADTMSMTTTSAHHTEPFRLSAAQSRSAGGGASTECEGVGPADQEARGEDDAGGSGLELAWNGAPAPRSYQVKAFRAVVKANRIVNLPTGTGKTLVAVMVMDHYLRVAPAKLVLFLVNTVSLVRQQARVLRQCSTTEGLKVVEVTGPEAQWDKRWWDEQRQSCQAMVLIAEVARKALADHAFLRVHQVSLLVFDEAHHAIRSHPYVIIAGLLKGVEGQSAAQQEPRILGLTASFLHGKFAHPEQKKERLQAKLHSQMWVPEEEDVRPFRLERFFERVSYDETPSAGSWEPESAMEDVFRPLLDDATVPAQLKTLFGKHRKHASDVFELLGWKGWHFYVSEGLCDAMRNELTVRTSRLKNMNTKALKALDSVQEKLRSRVSREPPPGIPARSGKSTALLTRLEELQDQFEDNFRCIVFVEQVATTYPLVHLINDHMRRPVSRPYSGSSSMPESVRKDNLDMFERGEAQILVATNSLEEGLDVPACNVVVRFDKFHNVKSHVQGMGRARMPDAAIIYFENEPDIAEAEAARMHEVARGQTVPSPMGEELARGGHILEYPFPFEHPNSDAKLDVHNCLCILYQYVASVLHKSVRPECIFEEELGEGGVWKVIRFKVPGPGGALLPIGEEDVAVYWNRACGSTRAPSRADFHELVRQEYGEVTWSQRSWERRRFAFVIVVELIRTGCIDEHNVPSPEAVQGDWGDCEQFLSPPDESTAGRKHLRFDPASLARAQRNPELDGEVGDEGLLVDREIPAADASRSTWHTGQSPPTLEPAKDVEEAPLGGRTLLANLFLDIIRKVEEVRHKPPKDQLDDLVHLWLQIHGRAALTGDIVYEVTATGPYAVVVHLTATDTHMSALTENIGRSFTCKRSHFKKADAEEDAARQAVGAITDYAQRALSASGQSDTYTPATSSSCPAPMPCGREDHLPSVSAAAGGLTLGRGAVPLYTANEIRSRLESFREENPKTQMNELMPVVLKRLVKKGEDFEYITTREAPFRSTLQLRAPELVQVAGDSFASIGDFRSKQEAEMNAAAKAVEAFRHAVALPAVGASNDGTGGPMPSASSTTITDGAVVGNVTSKQASVAEQRLVVAGAQVQSPTAANEGGFHEHPMGIRGWCAKQNLGEAVVDYLEAEGFDDPEELALLEDKDVDRIRESVDQLIDAGKLKLGHKARLLKCLKELRGQ